MEYSVESQYMNPSKTKLFLKEDTNEIDHRKEVGKDQGILEQDREMNVGG